MWKIIALVIIFLLAAPICFWFGRNIPFSEQWSLYEALRTTSAIVFGVMGAWIAIVFPVAITNIFSKDYKNKKNEIGKISRLLLPLSISTMILGYILLLGIAAPIFKQFGYFLDHVEIIRGISYSMLGILTLVQLWTLLLALSPGENLLHELVMREDKDEVMNRLTSNKRK